ncbi:MAG: DUF2135 domain-containing protein [Eggerthellaceae bacterium]|nr:DUF2135 domain-containing protein [Eggerthellaceae bacterium]
MMTMIPRPLVPTHWIDTTPVESRDVPCTIQALEMQVHVCGLYADVVETLVIRNPNRRDLSVGITIPLPDQAVVCGYALDVEDQMVDGVVVPKEKARVAFETEQRIGADPGLMESVKGNVYQTRVYPVPARRIRKVQLRYVAPLLVVDGESAFLDAPMPAEHLGLRKVNIDVELLDCPAPELSGLNDAQFKELGTFWRAESVEYDVETDSGLRVALPKLPQSFAIVERDAAGELWFSASERAPRAIGGDVPEITSLTVLWDISGSRADGDHEAEVELLKSYCAVDSIKSFSVITFNDHAELAREFESGAELIEFVESLRYDGGSDFKELSRAVAELPEAGDGAACVLFTDGLDTLSGEPVSFPKGRKMLAVVSGAQRDAEALRQACGGLVFDLMAAPKDADELARALFLPNLLSSVEGEGIAEFLGIGSGNDGRFSAVGRLVEPSTSITFENTGTMFGLSEDAAREGNTISHAWAALRVAQLSTYADENADELLKLGRRFGVVSPATSLLVLETLDQWLRYDIEPPLTWETMHEMWVRVRRDEGSLFPEGSREEYHLRSLKAAWAELKEWWTRDFSKSGFVVSHGRMFCRNCGSSIERDTRFCRNCGALVQNVHYAEIAEESASAFDTGTFSPIALPDCVDSYEEDSYSMPSRRESAPMPTCIPESSSLRRAVFAAEEPHSGDKGGPTSASVTIQAWMPSADYIYVLDASLEKGSESARDAYLEQRGQYAASPSFFIDCAGWFMANGDSAFGLHVLTNLVELRIEDAALLRVMAWRLREAGELERALIILRRVLRLRPEDSQSHRDLALVLDELARKAFAEGRLEAAKEFAEEAGSFYRKITLTPWERRAEAIALFAVEEYNVLRAWADAQAWVTAPVLEPLDEELEGVLDCDLRVTLAWDADETDVDLHVTEPAGEEAYYGNRRTTSGGRVSEDITDGYGPELYEIRHARNGVYTIRAHYFASHQQAVFGPASCTLTVYTDWGRPTQKQQITSTRVEREREMAIVGTATYGEDVPSERADEPGYSDKGEDMPTIVKGSSVFDLVAVYGAPTEGDPSLSDGTLTWVLPGERVRIATIVDGKADRVIESMPWGVELVIVQ